MRAATVAPGHQRAPPALGRSPGVPAARRPGGSESALWASCSPGCGSRATPGAPRVARVTVAHQVIRKPKKKVIRFCKEKAGGGDYKDTEVFHKIVPI